MVSPTPRFDILAFDFDGVLCDGLPEYFQSAWKTYSQLWHASVSLPAAGLEAAFGRLRPVIETGWEMPLLIDALVQGIGETEILSDWNQLTPKLLAQAPVNAPALAQHLDHLRDLTIQTDLDGWLRLHRFYPQALDCLRSQLKPESTIQPVIISTKEGRFIQQLLVQQGVSLPDAQIFGKEARTTKAEILQKLSKEAGGRAEPFNPRPKIWFIEDRLKTLLAIRKHAELDDIDLFLANWGYNTAQERHLAEAEASIQLLSLLEIGNPNFPCRRSDHP